MTAPPGKPYEPRKPYEPGDPFFEKALAVALLPLWRVVAWLGDHGWRMRLRLASAADRLSIVGWAWASWLQRLAATLERERCDWAHERGGEQRYPLDDGWFTQDGRDWTPPEASRAVEPMTGIRLAVRRAKGGPLSSDGAAEIEAFYAGLRLADTEED